MNTPATASTPVGAATASAATPTPALLTKSMVMSWRQCPRRLWLETHRPTEARPDAAQEKAARFGNLVGAAARHRLKLIDGADPVWISRDPDDAKVSSTTLRALLTSTAKSFVEVPATAQVGGATVYCRADALIRGDNPADGFTLQETKSSTFKVKKNGAPEIPDDHYIEDAAFQGWVFRQAGVPVTAVELNLIDPEFRMESARRPDELGDWCAKAFIQLAMNDEIASMESEIPQWIDGAHRTIQLVEMPEAKTGPRCNKPNACPFTSSCKKLEQAADPRPPLTLLPDAAGKALAKKLAATGGYESLNEVPPDLLASKSDPKRTALYQRIQRAHSSGQPQVEPAVVQALDALPYPRHWFDFEGMDYALPIWPEVSPYCQVPFQWSLHIERSPGAELEHRDFLDITGGDPSEDCLKAMIRHLGDGTSGCIVVYHAPYEKGRMQELAERFPQHAELIERWINQMVDLLPIVRDHFYSPVQSGSFSIKKVLKALAPSFDYSDLDVSSGVDAQLAYLRASTELLGPRPTGIELDKLVTSMRRYCERDSWAMHLVATKLREMAFSAHSA